MFRDEEGKIIFSPSDLITFMESRFDSWMDRFYLENPGQISPDEPDDGVKILQQKGFVHERAFLADLYCKGLDICVIPDGSNASASACTYEALQAGHDIVYQGVLQAGNFRGKSDFLVRVDGPSALGDFHYEVWDTKLARKPKPYFIVQLCCYAEMLQSVQGVAPETVRVVLGDKETKSFRTGDYAYFYRSLKNSFLEYQAAFDSHHPPEQIDYAQLSRWANHGSLILEQRDDLARVAGMRRSQARKLQTAGINTLTDLAQTETSDVERMSSITLANLKQQARLQSTSLLTGKPTYELLSTKPEERRGLHLLPPESASDVWFDMEGYPHIEGGLEYLFGVTYLDQAGEAVFSDWWAHDRDQERLAFENLIDWLYDRWRNNPELHVYHYASYEVSALRRLMGRYGTREQALDELLRNQVFVDLYRIVRNAVKVGEPRYSIKNLEHFYMGQRNCNVKNAVQSLVYYESWLEQPDGQDFHTSSILAEIRAYNKDDCDSTMLLTGWLRGLQKEANIAFVQPPEKSRSKMAISDNAALAKALLHDLSALECAECHGATERIQQLLAHLLEFHRREHKPVFWTMFDRQSMSQQQLVDDLECLGGLVRTTRAPEVSKQSLLYEFQFDPDQETKLYAGQSCLFAHDLSATKIERFDRQSGLLSVKCGNNRPAPPDNVALLPSEIYPIEQLEKALYRVCSQWLQTKQLRPALEDVLYRRPPRIHGRKAGARLAPAGSNSDEMIEAIVNLNCSTMCIQGPPGTGKTRLAAEAIVELLKQGKRVAITANAHKAIDNLLDQVDAVAGRKNLRLRAMKVGSDGDDRVENGDKNRIGRAPDGQADSIVTDAAIGLVGATAHKLCREAADDAFDFLFVDEAGQMSLANLVAISSCTRNIVLMGDQMQLDQPLQGAHPGESNLSILTYLLQDRSIVADDQGIFLPVSWRMHPEICDVISHGVYEGRLVSAPDTSLRTLKRKPGLRLIEKSSGVVYLPVEHYGNTQCSEEEAQGVVEVVSELLECDLMIESTRRVTLDDILIVAPFNMQVRLLRRLIPGARVASVDKFQGQEAPIVILSMCASEGNASPRGIEFLFSLNRLNVALSRAQTLAVVIANPGLGRTNCNTVQQMRLVNFFCRIVEAGAGKAALCSTRR